MTLHSGRFRSDTPDIMVMVRFLNPARPASEQINVWYEQHDGGFRLVQRQPDGDLHADRCPNRAALS